MVFRHVSPAGFYWCSRLAVRFLVWCGSVSPVLSLTLLWTNYLRVFDGELGKFSEVHMSTPMWYWWVGGAHAQQERVNREPPWRWFFIHAVMSLEVRVGGITKVQSDFLKLGSSDPDLSLHLKWRGRGLEYPMKQQPERGLHWKDFVWKNRWALEYQSESSRQISYCPVQDKWNYVLENTRRSIKKKKNPALDLDRNCWHC